MPRTPGAISKRRNKPAAQLRLWAAMRILRRFTLPDLVTIAEVSYDHARKLLNRLDAAGYVRKAVANDNGYPGSYAVFLLYRDTGPKPPVIGLDGVAYDQNLQMRMQDAHEQAKARKLGPPSGRPASLAQQEEARP